MYPEVMPGKLLVEEFPERTMTPTGLHLPSDPDKSPYEGHATVIAVGGPRKYSDGSEEPSMLCPGDEIWYMNNTSHQIHLSGKVYLIIREESVLTKKSKQP